MPRRDPVLAAMLRAFESELDGGADGEALVAHPNVRVAPGRLRTAARAAYRRAYPRAARRPLQVHHRVPLEWRHLFPGADPNRLSNLQGLPSLDHRRKASDLWDAFRAAYRRRGQAPTAADVLRYAGLVDRSLNLPYPL